MSDKQIIVLPIGSKVSLGCYRDPIDATVSAICLRGKNVSYEVVWWSGKERKEGWVTSQEIINSDEPKQRIGFGGQP